MFVNSIRRRGAEFLLSKKIAVVLTYIFVLFSTGGCYETVNPASRGQMMKENAIVGEEFLAKNKTREGVTTTNSGLQYEIVTEGTGATPTATDVVTTHYKGTLINGEEFDSSYKRGQPAKFPVNGVIKGWTEALQLMKVGAKWKLFIPAKLAYGENGAGGAIGPNVTLIFELELLGIEK